MAHRSNHSCILTPSLPPAFAALVTVSSDAEAGSRPHRTPSLLSPQQERVPTKCRLRSHGSSTSRGTPQARPPRVTSGRQPCSTLGP